MFLKLILKVQLLSAGIVSNEKVGFLAIILIRTLIAIAVGGMVNAVFATDQASYKTITLGLLSCITFSASLQIITKYYEDELSKVTEKLCQNWYSFTDKVVNHEAELEAERKYWFRMIALMVSCVTPLFCPYFYFITKPGITLDDVDLQVIPYFMAFWQINNLSEYVSMVMLQLSITGITILAYWSFTFYTIYVMVNLQKHVENLHREFDKAVNSYVRRTFERRLVKCGNYQEEVFINKRLLKVQWDETNGILNEDFINVIKYQQYLHSYVTDFTTFISRAYTSVFYWYISSTIVFSYSFLQVINDVVFFFKTLSMVIHGTLALYQFCYSAQVVNHLNESIQDAFYYTEWYYLPLKLRKNMIGIMLHCQRKYRITTFSMFVVNLSLFIRSLRIVYSVLNVVLVAQKK